jgi:uncharacterized protein YbjT (DUF2867 family)
MGRAVITQSLEAFKAKGIVRRATIETIHSYSCSEPLVGGEFFSVVLKQDITFKGKPCMSIEEIGIFQVKDGKIIKEHFFYRQVLADWSGRPNLPPHDSTFGYNIRRFHYARFPKAAEFYEVKIAKKMKIVLTGSLGHISKPLAEILVRQGHTVTVISSKQDKAKDINAIGAVPAIGSLEDPNFLTASFKGADAVYLMEPPGNFFDPNFDVHEHVAGLARNFVQAVQDSSVRRVVHLSSIGAHTDQNNGLLKFHYNVEKILGQLPAGVAISFMRPVGFYYNLLSFIPIIRSHGAIITNYGGDDPEPWVSPLDIAATVASTITQPFAGRTVQYIASDERSPNEVASILGAAIGRPDLKWVIIPDQQALDGMLAAGMNPSAARGLVEMNAGRRGGRLYEDYFSHRPVLGKVKMTEFASEFAAAYANANPQPASAH